MDQVRTPEVTTRILGLLILIASILCLQIIQVGSFPQVTSGADDLQRELLDSRFENVTKIGQDLHGSNRNRRAECPASPGDESCIPCPGDPIAMNLQYEHTDENGITCMCELCRAPMYMYGPCICTSAGTQVWPKCIFPIKGVTFMPFHNRCRVPFRCTVQCPGNMILIQDCNINQDGECGCADGYYKDSDTTCQPIPTCPKNHHLERTQELDEEYTSYTCVPCNITNTCNEEPPATPSPEEPTPHSSDEVTTTDKTAENEDPTNFTQIHPHKEYHLSRNNLITIIVVLAIILCSCVAFLLWLVLKNKNKSYEQTSQQEERPANSVAQFQQNDDGGTAAVDV